MIRTFAKDRRGVSAVEFALLAPLLAYTVGGCTNLWFQATQRSAVNYTAGAVAAIGGRAIKDGCAAAQSAAGQAFDANKAMFLPIMTPTLGAVDCVAADGSATNDPVAVRVMVSSTMAVPFPVLWPGGSTVTASQTATD